MSVDPFEAFIAQLDLSGIPGSDDPMDEEELEQRDRLERAIELLQTEELEHLPHCRLAEQEVWSMAAQHTMQQYQIRFEADSHDADGPIYRLKRQQFYSLMTTCIAMAVKRLDPDARDFAADTMCATMKDWFDRPEDQFEFDVPALLSAMKKACYIYAQLWPQPPG